jgi:DNA polymerase III sliding clamp (beta) subunit (PCNA family)
MSARTTAPLNPLPVEGVLVSRRPLLDALALMCRVAVRDAVTPIHECVRLECEGEALVLTADEGALRLRVVVPAVGLLAPVIIRAKAGVNNLGLVIEGDGAVFTLQGGDPAAFREPPAPIDGVGATFEGPVLARLLNRTLYGIAAEGNRYGLNGLHIEFVDGAARFVSTDGNRLQWAEGPFAGELAPPRKMLVPRAAAAVLDVLVGAAPVTLRLAARAFEAQGPDWTLSGRLLEADFPDYRQVLPQSHKRAVVVDRAAIVKALRRVALFARDSSSTTRWALREGAVELMAKRLDYGESRASVPVGLTGAPLTFGLNARFALDVLTRLPDGPVEIRLGDMLSPVVVQSLVDKTSTALVMPVRLD